MDNKAEFTKEQLITHIREEIHGWNEVVRESGAASLFAKKSIAAFEIALEALTAEPVTITPETCRKFYADGVRAGWEFRSKNDTAGYNNVIETIMGAIK